LILAQVDSAIDSDLLGKRIICIMDNDPNDFEPTPVIDDQPPYGSVITPQTHSKRRLVIAAIIVLLVGGAAAYWFLHKQPSAPNTTASTSALTTAPNQPLVPDDTQAENTNGNYVSNGTDLNLSFSYPSDWTVTPPSNSNPNDQPITITSPVVSITGANGQSTNGKVVVSIRPGGSTLSELSSGSATAGQASAQIAYNKPTSAQHQYPYLTYIHLAGGANPSSNFEEVVITGVTSFAKDQAILASSLGQLDPIISARFYACSSQTCATNSASSLSITNTAWQNAPVALQTLAIFQSLQIN
jgi:hypothetical protein